jgi:hypothetical protein
MLSRSTLAHIYDNVKVKTARTSPLVGSAKRGLLGLHHARSACIQIRHSMSCELIRFPSATAQSDADEAIPKIHL